MARRWHLIVDVDRCEDCNNCLLACKDEHVDNDWPGYAAPQPRHGHRWIDILRRERGQHPQVDMAYLPVTCMHCDRAPCVEAGKGVVIKRGDGVVLIDPEAARGRKDLVDSCPYGMISWNEEAELPQKCTLCAHLLDSWWEQPRCVQACPTGALTIVQAEEAEHRAMMHRENLEYLHAELGSVPTVLYRNLYRYFSHRLAGSVTVERDGVVDCAKGARVELWKLSVGVPAESAASHSAAASHGVAAAGGSGAMAETDTGARVVASTETDPFGDFVFDRLDAAAADYEIVVSLGGYRPERLAVRAEESRSVGTIHLTAEEAPAAGSESAVAAGEPARSAAPDEGGA